MSEGKLLSHQTSCCGRVNRRVFLADCGMGFTGLVLGAMMQRDGILRADAHGVWSPPDGKPHFAPKAKSVIWLFMLGGVSHVESFDPKPILNKYGGKSIDATFYANSVSLKLSDGRSLMVPQAMSASGARYANKDETFVFWNKGDTAFVTEGKDGKETYSGCATKP